MVGRVYFFLLGARGIAVGQSVTEVDGIWVTDETYCRFTFPLGWECSGPADMIVVDVRGRVG